MNKALYLILLSITITTISAAKSQEEKQSAKIQIQKTKSLTDDGRSVDLSQEELLKDQKKKLTESIGQNSVKEIKNSVVVLPDQSSEETNEKIITDNQTPMQKAVNDRLVDMVEKNLENNLEKKYLTQSMPTKKLSDLDIDKSLMKRANSEPVLNKDSKLVPEDLSDFVKIFGLSAIILAMF